MLYEKNKQEIDFIVKEGDKLIAINVNYTDKIIDRELNGLKEFENKYRSKIKKLIRIKLYKQTRNLRVNNNSLLNIPKNININKKFGIKIKYI